MPSPVMLKVEFEPTGPAIQRVEDSRMVDSTRAIDTWPVNVWFTDSKTFLATLDFGGRAIRKFTLDPFGRFPDRDVTHNVWPR